MWQIPHSLRASPLFRNICKQVLAKNTNCSITLHQREKSHQEYTPHPQELPNNFNTGNISFIISSLPWGFFFLPEMEEKLQLIKLQNIAEVCIEIKICWRHVLDLGELKLGWREFKPSFPDLEQVPGVERPLFSRSNSWLVSGCPGEDGRTGRATQAPF